MSVRTYGKAVVTFFVLGLLVLSSAQAVSFSRVKQTDSGSLDVGWHWKASYPNYAPKGMPDFSQQQDRWKKISPGPNGVINSTVVGDDVLNLDENCIAPGPDCYLNSTAAGDDVEEWVFCGPVAVANCFWWFDSKYADPAGYPGDGNDQFSLVGDYGAGDDHASANAPLLIEDLARAMNTTEKGTTHIGDMQTGVEGWFNDTGLADRFTVETYNRPSFSFIEEQIEASQDVILLLGSYNFTIGPKVVDQQQPLVQSYLNDQLQTMTWNDFQSFTPNVTRLDAIQICLVSNGQPCNVEVNVYDTYQSATPIGTSVFNPGMLAAPTWVQFHFSPHVALVPGNLYYFDVRVMVAGQHYEWFYINFNVLPGDPYSRGSGWMDTNPVDYFGLPFDWSFKTEYYSPPPHSERLEGHYVTCAGVNSDDFKIAFSDPTLDVANATASNHNDAANVSHDIYDVTLGSPEPDIDCLWWLPGYPSAYNYTVVEQAVVICPVPDTTLPIIEITKPINALYIFNFPILYITVPVILGTVDVNVTATDNDSGIDRVEFYVDNQLKTSDPSAPYSWVWSERAFFYYTLKVVAYDKAGNSDYKELKVWKFF
ncbi:MAG: hypothetical protein JXA00_04080 [Candidatus Thermoplasmatota archaeon]|nr:hypothetical protein [Candidatus Thermoplasmatota archaeon]